MRTSKCEPGAQEAVDGKVQRLLNGVGSTCTLPSDGFSDKHAPPQPSADDCCSPLIHRNDAAIQEKGQSLVLDGVYH